MSSSDNDETSGGTPPRQWGQPWGSTPQEPEGDASQADLSEAQGPSGGQPQLSGDQPGQWGAAPQQPQPPGGQPQQWGAAPQQPQQQQPQQPQPWEGAPQQGGYAQGGYPQDPQQWGAAPQVAAPQGAPPGGGQPGQAWAPGGQPQAYPQGGGWQGPAGQPGSSGGGSRRGPLIAALVIGLVLVLGVGAWAATRFLSGSGDDLIGLVPAEAALYARVNLNPSAANKLGLMSLVDRVNAAAGEELIDLDTAMEEIDPTLGSFAEDIDPWLGDQVGIFLLADGSDAQDPFAQPSGAAIATVDDAEAAIAYVQRASGGGTYNGDIEGAVALDDDAIAVIHDGRLLLGDEGGVLAAMGDGPRLSDAAEYTETIAELPDHVASVYISPAFTQLAGGGLAALGGALPGMSAEAGSTAIAVSFTADAIRLSSVGAQAPQLTTLSLTDLPDGGIAYFAAPDIGTTIRNGLQSIEQMIPGGQGVLAEADGALQPFGVTAQQLIDSLGDLAGYIAYDPASTTDNAHGAILLALDDPDPISRLLGAALPELLPPEAVQQLGLEVGPASIRSGELFLGVEDSSTFAIRAGSPPSTTLGEDPTYLAAVDGLAGQPSVYLDLRRIADVVVRATNSAGDMDAEELLDIQRGLRVLAAFDSMVATSEARDGRSYAEFRISFGSDLEPLDVTPADFAIPDIDLGGLNQFLAPMMSAGIPDAGGFETPLPPPPVGDLTIPVEPDTDLGDLGFPDVDEAAVLESMATGLRNYALELEAAAAANGGQYVPIDESTLGLDANQFFTPIIQPDSYCIIAVDARLLDTVLAYGSEEGLSPPLPIADAATYCI